MQLQTEKMCTKWKYREEETLLAIKINQNIEEQLGNNFHVIAKQNLVLNQKAFCTNNFPTFLCFSFSTRILVGCDYLHHNHQLLAFDS